MIAWIKQLWRWVRDWWSPPKPLPELTADMLTAKALAVLHQRLNFVSSINREYDEEETKAGAKIGHSIRIRMPVQHKVDTGK